MYNNIYVNSAIRRQRSDVGAMGGPNIATTLLGHGIITAEQLVWSLGVLVACWQWCHSRYISRFRKVKSEICLFSAHSV